MSAPKGAAFTISAVLAVRNEERYVEEAVRSLAATGWPELEIVVVDDGSTDRTLEIVRALAEEVEAVRVLRHPDGGGRGVSASRNLGIRESEGELICFLDGDDRVFPHRFDRAAEILGGDPGIDGVYDTVRLVFEDEDDPWVGRELFGPTEPAAPDELLDVLLDGTVWAVSGVLFRRALLDRTGLFREGMAIAEDCSLWFRMAAAGTLVAGELDRPVGIYRRHGSNTFRPDLARKAPMVAAMADTLRWSRGAPVRPGASATLRRHLVRYLTDGVLRARREGRTGVGWSMLGAAASEGAAGVLLRRPVLRQALGLAADAVRGGRKQVRSAAEEAVLPLRRGTVRRRLEDRLAEDPPRVAVVKQDVQDDLYCAGREASAREIVLSTLMRTGPVALFTRLDADFVMVETEDDPETSVWRQRWEEVRWTPIERMEELRDRIPGRDHGQGEHAVEAADVDWSRWDVVIGVDVAVPARVTRRFPSVVWAYYVREPKTSAWRRSLESPLPGMDLFLDQGFGLSRPERAAHVVHFPYYLQYHGCFHDLLGEPRPATDPPDGSRRGVFLEHHTPGELTPGQVERLEAFGPVDSTAARSSHGFEKGGVKSDRSAEAILRSLMASKYFVKVGGPRNVFGNAMIEAVAAGCLAIGDPARHVHADLYDRETSAADFDEVVRRLERFESDPGAYRRAVDRQRELVDHLCWERPMLELLEKVDAVRAERAA